MKSLLVLDRAKLRYGRKKRGIVQELRDLVLIFRRSFDGKDNPGMVRIASHPHRLHRAMSLIEDSVDLCEYRARTSARNFIRHRNRLHGEVRLEAPEQSEGNEDDDRSESGGYIEPTARGHTHSSYHKERSGGREAYDASARVEDGACTDEANPWNNLRRYAGVVAAVAARQLV